MREQLIIKILSGQIALNTAHVQPVSWRQLVNDSTYGTVRKLIDIQLLVHSKTFYIIIYIII